MRPKIYEKSSSRRRDDVYSSSHRRSQRSASRHESLSPHGETRYVRVNECTPRRRVSEKAPERIIRELPANDGIDDKVEGALDRRFAYR